MVAHSNPMQQPTYATIRKNGPRQPFQELEVVQLDQKGNMMGSNSQVLNPEVTDQGGQKSSQRQSSTNERVNELQRSQIIGSPSISKLALSARQP